MNTQQFLLEFCDSKTNDTIENSPECHDYFVACASGIIFDEIVTASQLVAHQKLDVNTYIERVR